MNMKMFILNTYNTKNKKPHKMNIYIKFRGSVQKGVLQTDI